MVSSSVNFSRKTHTVLMKHDPTSPASWINNGVAGASSWKKNFEGSSLLPADQTCWSRSSLETLSVTSSGVHGDVSNWLKLVTTREVWWGCSRALTLILTLTLTVN
jgi:hypothetical protein